MQKREMTRREAIRATSLAFGGVLLQGRPQRGRTFVVDKPITSTHHPRHFTPVNVARERIIRTVVGLRPHRPSGFVVRAESMGDKLLVHNYGHGGGGVTLSWGTAQLAADLVTESGKTGAAAVIGCGVVGLSTARLLQRRGFDVTIYAKALPPETTSNIAGASWSPTAVVAEARRTPAFDAQFERAARIAHRAFQLLAVVTDDFLYMFPRRDGIVLGGTFERGVETLEPNPEAEEGVLAGHQRLFNGMR